MNADKKAKTARTLGITCLGAALFNAILAIVLMAVGRQGGRPLLVTAIGLFTIGIIMVARGKGKSTPDA